MEGPPESGSADQYGFQATAIPNDCNRLSRGPPSVTVPSLLSVGSPRVAQARRDAIDGRGQGVVQLLRILASPLAAEKLDLNQA